MIISFFYMDISGVGGMERMTLRLASELHNQGYKIIIVSLFGSGKPFFPCPEEIDIQVLYPKKPNNYISYFSIAGKMRRLFKDYQVDVHIDTGIVNSLFSLQASRGLKTKIISWEHFNYLMPQIRWRLWIAHRAITRYSAAVVTLTHEDANLYKKNHHCKAKVLCIPNFLPTIPKEQSKMSSRNILAVGRLNYQKGFDILLDCWKEIHSASGLEDWTLRIVGSGEDRESLLQQSEKLGLTDCVELVPSTDKTSDYYESSSIYAMTSRWEGLPMVLIEAKSYGLPIVSFDCRTGPSEIIRNGVDGILVPDKDAEIFIRSMISLMRDESRRENMSSAAKADAVRFESSSVVGQWKSLIQSL